MNGKDLPTLEARLGHLVAAFGDRRMARTLLAAVYHRFTEGFDITDVVTAKTLLESFR